jgi:NAD(P)-dependent dehydrogenase (short-subunit alcohol dehydrogenase family)
MRTAIVTGGASGIGRAIAAALVTRGAHVTVADINGSGAEQVAAELAAAGPGTAVAAKLDVTDAAAVSTLYQSVKVDHGNLDLVFNNAGIAIGGLAEELSLQHWNRAIDVNLKGVVHGVHAAYPIMLEQRAGHIVNTASLAGLVPMPMGIPYTATKHAVVGLSLGLRAEAASRGVKVSVVCPGFVDTPLLTSVNPDLPETLMSGDARADIKQSMPRLYTAEKLARDIMRGVAKNQALIVAPASGRAAWRAMRLAPNGGVRAAQLAVNRLRGKSG